MSPLSPFLAPERDYAVPWGHPASATNYYCLPGVFQTSTTTIVWNGSGEIKYFPHYLTAPIIVDQIAAEVTALTAATNFRMGLYAADRRWQPVGAPLMDSGSISTATNGVKTYTPATPVVLPRGRYVSCTNADNGTVTMRAYVGGMTAGPSMATTMGSTMAIAWNVSSTYGAFATPGLAWTATDVGSSGFQFPVVFRVTTP